MEINFILNDEPVTLDTDPTRRLIDVLREDYALTGAKEGCGEGECGACTILMDEVAVHSCLILVGQVEGHRILTIEGLTRNGQPDPLQEAFVREMAIQCGGCTPGMIMSAKGLLLANPDPTEEEIKVAIAGNICRCSNYEQIVRAIQAAAKCIR